MALNLKPINQQTEEKEIEEYNIVEQRKQMTEQLVNSQEIDDIVSAIDVYQPQQLVSFGAEAAEGISKCSDQILNSINMNQVNDSGELLKTLGKIMDKFDLEEIAEEEKKGFFRRLAEGLSKTRNNIVSGMDAIFNGFSDIDDDFYDEIEEILVMGDIGINATTSIIENLKKKVKEQHIKKPEECKELLINSIKEQMQVGETAYDFENP